MEENRPVKKRDTYKRLITFSEGIVLLAVEVYMFGIVWYRYYSDFIDIPFWRRGN